MYQCLKEQNGRCHYEIVHDVLIIRFSIYFFRSVSLQSIRVIDPEPEHVVRNKILMNATN